MCILKLSACTPDERSNTEMNIQSLIQEYVDGSGAVGAAVGFIDNGKVQFYTYGKKSVNGDKPISEDTIFEIGSITKVFTTLAFADMAERGSVRLDDPVEKYLPEINKKISLLQLASHTSGLPRMPDLFNPQNPNNPYADYTAQKLLDDINRCTITRTPGESFEYSNIGMGLLSHILCRHSGKSYEKLIRSAITEPLGMKNTSVHLTPEMIENFAHGHHQMQEVEYWDFTGLAGTGALRSNIKDMTLFLSANMGLTKSPLEALLEKCHQKVFAPSPAFAVGLGWIVSQSNNAEIIYHNGGTGGFRSYLGFNPKLKRGVVVLSNSTEEWPDELGLVLLDPDFKRPVVDKSLATSEYLGKFAGAYVATHSNRGPDVQLAVYETQLACVLSSGEFCMLYPESHGVFGIKGFPEGKVYFTFDDKGNVSKIKALIAGEQVMFEAEPKKVATAKL
jgi:D-alanyl-D-alanine-carboxypeptidase/D-alanyl-D-alanine-endopeptidase